MSAPTPVIWEHNRGIVDQILQCIADGEYCALLGPRFYGKTAIVRHVKQSMQNQSRACFLVDLFQVQAPTLVGFFGMLAAAIHNDIVHYTEHPIPEPAEELQSAAFRDFLAGCVDGMGTNLVVIFDHLEELPADLNRALLTSLRALYMEQQEHELRFIAVVSGALSLAALTVGETSPFHGIARRLIVGDLDEVESADLVVANSTSSEVHVSPAARAALFVATRGNPHLIKHISKRSIALASKTPSKQLTAQTVNRVVREFLGDDAPKYDLLEEAVHLIEDDPDLLQCILKLLRSEIVPLRELPLPLSPDLDPLYLTGMVEKVEPSSYRIRNGIYRQYLNDHFDAAHTGYLLTVSGRWEAAIGHLEASILSGNNGSLSNLLAATINAMYASETEEQAAHFLTRGLSAGFRVGQISIWQLARNGESLGLLDWKGTTMEGALLVEVRNIPVDADQIEARSFRQACVLREHPDETSTRYVIPLMVPGQTPVGVVTLRELRNGNPLSEQRKREFQLQSYLNQAARAFFEVEFRRNREARVRVQDEELEQKTSQLLLLHRVSTLSQTIADLDKISHLVLTAITAHFGLGFNRAWLLLIDRESSSLKGSMAIGSLTEGHAYQTWSAPPSFDEYLERLFNNQLDYNEIDEPSRKLSIPISETSHDLFSLSVFQHDTFQWSGEPGHWYSLPREFMQIFEPGEMIITPLVVHNECLGLIAVDNKFRPRPYTESDELMLKTFANQMATAIFNFRQHEQEMRRLRLEETLRDTSVIIARSLEPKEVLDRILEEMRKVLPFDTASIQLANEEFQSLRIIADTGFADPQSVEALIFPLKGDYPNVRVYEQRKPLHFDDIRAHFPHFADPHYQATHAHGWLGAPLISNDMVIGVITLDSNTPGIYTSEHDRLAVLFAGQATVAIQNARLYEAERETREYLDLLISSSQDGIIAVDNAGKVVRYGEGAEKILGYSQQEVKELRVDELYGSLEVAKDINKGLHTSASNRVRDYSTTIIDKAKNIIPIVVSASLLRDKNGSPIGSVGFFKDMRPLRKVETDLRTILGTVTVMSRVSHSEEGLSALAERIVTERPVTFCSILLRDESKQNLIVKVSYPDPRPRSNGVRWKSITGTRINIGQDILMAHLLDLPQPRVFQKGQMLEGLDVPRYLKQFISLQEEIRSILVVPLMAGSEIFGLCIIGETRSWSRSPFDPEKVELISSMVTQGTVFVDRLRAHEATKKKLLMVERLRSIGEELVAATSSETAKSILNQVVEAACEVTGASNSVIYPWDKEMRTYETDKIVHIGLRKQKAFSEKLRDEEGSMTGIVIRTGMVIVDDVHQGRDRSGEIKIWANPDGFLEIQGVQAFVGVSLRTGEDSLGVLFVNFLEPHFFSDSELEAVTLFANQAAVAIENARLYEDLARRLEESLTLQKVGIALAETRDQELLLNRVMQAALELIHADEGNILFYDESKDEFRSDALVSGGLGLPLQQYKTSVRQHTGNSYQIISSRKPIRIPDTASNPDINKVTLEKGRGAVLGVPLIGREKPVGVLWVNWKIARRFTEQDERLLMALASQAAVFIENVDLFDKLRDENTRRNEESQALQEVGISLTEPIQLNEVLYRVLQAALELIHGDEGSILFYDESRDEFDSDALMCAGVDRPLETYRTKVRQRSGLAYQIVKERKPVFISDTKLDPRISQVAIDKGRRATVGVPLLDSDGPVGVLWVNWKETRQVSSTEANLLTALASQATVAIKGARRYAEIQRKTAHLQAVHEAGKVISEASVGMNRQQILDRILEQAIECVTGISGSKASVGTIQLLDEETNELVVKSVFPQEYPEVSIDKFNHILPDLMKQQHGELGITGRAAMTRQAQLVRDVSQDVDYVAHNADTKSELAIPILENEKVIGVMDVESNELNAFDELDKDSLSLLVDLAVVALRNAKQAEELTRSNAVGLMGAWGAEIVHDVNREVGHIRREVFLLKQKASLSDPVRDAINAIDEFAAQMELPEIPERVPDNDVSTSPATAILDSTIHEAVGVYRSNHPHISFQFEPGCPDTAVTIHERFIRSIFLNLLRNAVHALNQEETVDKTIQIRSRVEGSMAVIDMENSGPSLRSEIVPFLFKRLFPHKDGRKGRGLLLVGFLVEQHGGRIEAVPIQGEKGVLFRFWLPIFGLEATTVEV